MKAQYEVLGNDAKRDIRPGRDDRKFWFPVFVMPLTSVSSPRSSHPGRIASENANQHFVLGNDAKKMFSSRQGR
jgi:hypothetical protein